MSNSVSSFRIILLNDKSIKMLHRRENMSEIDLHVIILFESVFLYKLLVFLAVSNILTFSVGSLAFLKSPEMSDIIYYCN